MPRLDFRSSLKRATALSGNSAMVVRYWRLESVIRERSSSVLVSVSPSALSCLLTSWANLPAVWTQPLQNSIPALSVASCIFAVSTITARISWEVSFFMHFLYGFHAPRSKAFSCPTRATAPLSPPWRGPGRSHTAQASPGSQDPALLQLVAHNSVSKLFRVRIFQENTNFPR